MERKRKEEESKMGRVGMRNGKKHLSNWSEVDIKVGR